MQRTETMKMNPYGTPLYENTMQYAILKKEWDSQKQ